MRKLLTATVALAALLMTAPAEATTSQAKARAYRIASALKKQGINFRNDYWHGLLKYKGSTTIKTTLKANTNYVLVGGGCADAYDVDIIVYDQNWNEVGRDTKVDATPVVRVRPKWSGTFYIKVKLAKSTRNGAHYALIVGYK
ncbi:MAG: hypothetical protein ACPG32_01570 [Akkermansiaceae bacterium]